MLAFTQPVSREPAPVVPRGWSKPQREKPRVAGRIPVLQTPSPMGGCETQQIVRARSRIVAAIRQGVPLYNRGKREACFRLYDEVARELDAGLPMECSGVRSLWRVGIEDAGKSEAYGKKAWALRRSFDAVLKISSARLKASSS